MFQGFKKKKKHHVVLAFLSQTNFNNWKNEIIILEPELGKDQKSNDTRSNTKIKSFDTSLLEPIH